MYADRRNGKPITCDIGIDGLGSDGFATLGRARVRPNRNGPVQHRIAPTTAARMAADWRLSSGFQLARELNAHVKQAD